MRLVRITALIAAAAIIVLGGLAALVVYHQQEVLRLVLDRVNQRTGLAITPYRGTLELLRGRLVLVLERPRVQQGNRTIASLKELRAVISYHSLVYSKGLPLSDLVLVDPTFYCEPISFAPANLVVPKGREFASNLTDLARRLTLVARRIEITDATFVGGDNTALAEKFSLSAFRRHYPWAPWQISFEGIWHYGRLAGMHAAATFSVMLKSDDAGRMVSRGVLWFWAVPLQGLTHSDFKPAGELQGEIHFGLSGEGELAGRASLRAKALAIGGPLLKRPLILGENAAHALFRLENGRAEFTRLVARHNNSQLLAGELTVQDLYSWDTALSGHISGLRLDLLQTRLWLKQVRGLNTHFLDALDRISSGSAMVEAAFKLPSLADCRSRLALLKGLSLTIRLDNLGIVALAGSRVPAIQSLSGRLTYGSWALNVNQLAAAVGRSRIEELSGSARISHDLKSGSYSVRATGEAQLDDLYPIVDQELSERLSGRPGMRISALNGEADFQLEAAGVMTDGRAAMPADYTIVLAPRRGELTLERVPDKIALRGGTLTISPRMVQLDKFTLTPATGTLILSGELRMGADGISSQGLEAEVHGVRVDPWLSLWMEPQALSVSGQAGGQVVLNTTSQAGRWAATGTLTMGQGEFRFGFLRAPIAVRSASLVLDGRGLRLAMPASLLEGAPLDFELSVADLKQPVLRIDAVAQRMDLEVLTFMRLPWAPRTPTTFFRTKVVGHLEAPQAKFDKLAMEGLAADFERDKGDWWVRNFKARAFAGEVAAEFAGRARDDWIHIKGRIDGMEAKPLFLLPGTRQDPPILEGQLFAEIDLWGDTGEQFFNTLAGKVSFELRDGSLRKFTLLSRMLELIDLKSWLTARVPDPRVSGVPFRRLTGDFAGKDGDFFSDNILLDGPVMQISAQGDLNVGAGTTNMQVAVLPFQTVRWLTENIPLVGENVAGVSSSLLGAYFQVRGPIADPTVLPKPITSATQIIKKMLGLPFNIIRPDTIR